MRTRSTGTGFPDLLSIIAGRYEAFYVKAKSFGPLVREYKTISVGPYAASNVSSNIHTITDTGGQSRGYKFVNHLKDDPVRLFTPTLSLDVGEPADDLFGNTIDWYLYRLDLFGGPGEISPCLVYGNDWPKGSLPSIDWTTLVSEVGQAVDGHLTAKSNILTTVAELGKTIAMLKSPMRSIRALASASNVKTFGKAAASGYLEYRYGWRQLKQDITAISSAIQSSRSHLKWLRDNVGSLQTFSRQERRIWGPGEPYLYAPHSYMSLGVTLDTYERVAVFSCMTVLEASVLKLSRMDLLLDQLGAKDLVTALWDLIPYSFVVDWFFDVGGLLSIDPASYFSVQSKSTGYSIKETWKFKSSMTVNLHGFWNGATREASTDCGASNTRVVYQRVPGFPPGSSEVGAFGGLSKTQLADGAALILQRI